MNARYIEVNAKYIEEKAKVDEVNELMGDNAVKELKNTREEI